MPENQNGIFKLTENSFNSYRASFNLLLSYQTRTSIYFGNTTGSNSTNFSENTNYAFVTSIKASNENNNYFGYYSTTNQDNVPWFTFTTDSTIIIKYEVVVYIQNESSTIEHYIDDVLARKETGINLSAINYIELYSHTNDSKYHNIYFLDNTTLESNTILNIDMTTYEIYTPATEISYNNILFQPYSANKLNISHIIG